MCKGEELSAFLREHGEYDRVVYIGDGSNDFCPVLRLREWVISLPFHPHLDISSKQTRHGPSPYRERTPKAHPQGRGEIGAQV